MFAIGQEKDETLTAWAERVLEETKDDGSVQARLLRVEAKLSVIGAHVVESAEGLDRIAGSPVAAADPETAARVSYEKDKTIEALQSRVNGYGDAFDKQVEEIRGLQAANADLQAKLDAMTQERNQLQDKLTPLTGGGAS